MLLQLKYETAINKGLPAVTPDWVLNCVSSQCICEEKQYDPRLLTFPRVCSPSPPVENFELAGNYIIGNIFYKINFIFIL